ncbi:MAG TPA: phytanoyl-CoA dioxygenase family protein [Planctomycetota bacterium]|nr:phytanoyl-CoA dioxygenase family protein [Planctomycetota bacterium]
MLTATEIAHFRTHGYVAMPRFLDPDELAALRVELGRLRSAGKLRNVSTDADGATHSQTRFNLQICPIGPLSPVIEALRFAPQVVATVGALVGHPVRFVLDQIFLKPANEGAGTAWHQDAAYWPIVTERERGLGMWLALDDATVANGTMHVVPGSHRALRPHYRDPNSDHHIRADEPEGAVPVELPAGGALFFNYGVLHCTRDNRTARDRAGLALHFIADAIRPPEFAVGEPLISDAHGGATRPEAWRDAIARPRAVLA